MEGSLNRQSSRLPFFYGWVVVAIAFLTMGIGVNSRTAFSLLFPQMLDEFGWEVQTDGTRLLATAISDEEGAAETGAVFAFEVDETGWQ